MRAGVVNSAGQFPAVALRYLAPVALARVLHPFAVIDDLKRTIVSIRDRWRTTRLKNQRLRKDRDQWRARAEQLQQDADRLQQDADRLQRETERLQRERDRL